MKKKFLTIIGLTLLSIAYDTNLSSPCAFNLISVGSLRTSSGTFLANVCAKYITDDVFTELHITGKDGKLLYRIDKNGFFNSSGMEREGDPREFYGFGIRRPACRPWK